MAGILLISELTAYVVMNSRAIHSFISIIFIVKSCTACKKFDRVLEVTIPLGRILNTNKIVRALKLEMNGNELKTDIYFQNIKDFDVILGRIGWGAPIRLFDI